MYNEANWYKYLESINDRVIEEQNEANNWRKDPNIKNTSPITLKELQKALKSLNQKVTMVSTNGVNNKFLKRIPTSLQCMLVVLFNRCIDNNFLPASWKKGHISLLFNKGNKSEINNYRPISITSAIMKVFEHIMLNRLNKFLAEKLNHKNTMVS